MIAGAVAALNFVLANWRSIVACLAAVFVTWQTLSLYDDWIDDPAVRAAALKGYVLEAEKVAAEALAAERMRQMEVAQEAATKLQADLAALTTRYTLEDQQNERDIAEYQKRLDAMAGRAGCRLTQSDIDWLRRKAAPQGGK